MGLNRYPTYKPSGVPWIGDIPDHWRVVPGRSLYAEKKVPNNGLKETKVLSLSYGKIRIRGEEELHGLVPASFESYQMIEPGDIICRPTDLQNDWNSLRFGLSPHKGIITSAYICFKTKLGVDRRYGHLLFHTYDLKKVFYGLGSGLRQNLAWEDFKHLPCLQPATLDEQGTIVRFLDHADEQIQRYISSKERLIALLEEERQVLVHQAVTRSLDPNVRLKPSGVEWLGDVPEHWEVMPIKRAFVSMDYGISESASDSGTVRLLTMGNLRDGQVIVPHEGGVDFVDPYLLLREGDLLFNRTNSRELVGKVGLFIGYDSPTTFASYLVRMRPHSTHEPEYLNMALNDVSFISHARRESVPSLHQSNLNPTRYGRIHVALPPKKEQGAIIRTLVKETARLKDSATRTRNQIDLMNEYRTRLIADVVTGQLDVRQADKRLSDIDAPALKSLGRHSSFELLSTEDVDAPPSSREGTG